MEIQHQFHLSHCHVGIPLENRSTSRHHAPFFKSIHSIFGYSLNLDEFFRNPGKLENFEAQSHEGGKDDFPIQTGDVQFPRFQQLCSCMQWCRMAVEHRTFLSGATGRGCLGHLKRDHFKRK